jgi:outer membrane lipoprotein LolB
VVLEVANQGRYEAEAPKPCWKNSWLAPAGVAPGVVGARPARPGQQEPLTLDGDSRLASLEQDGWQVQYLSYTEQNGYWLPERLKLHGRPRRDAGDQGLATAPAGALT